MIPSSLYRYETILWVFFEEPPRAQYVVKVVLGGARGTRFG